MSGTPGLYGAGVSIDAPHHRTLWEEGRTAGRLVVTVAAVATALVLAVDLLLLGGVNLLFDVLFVLVCVGAALGVRPHDFFVVGVLPPLLMAGSIALVATTSRGDVADAGDGFLQAMVSGLAHHAGALVVGYGLTLAILALRQVALRNAGTIRASHQPPRERRTPVG